MTRPPVRPRSRSLSLTKTFLPLTAPRILGASAIRIIAQSENLWCCKPEHGPKMRKQIRKRKKQNSTSEELVLQDSYGWSIDTTSPSIIQPVLPLLDPNNNGTINSSQLENDRRLQAAADQAKYQTKMNSKRIPHQYQFRGWNSLQTGPKQEVWFWPILRVPSSPQKWEILKQFADAKGYPKDTCNVPIKTQYHRS